MKQNLYQRRGIVKSSRGDTQFEMRDDRILKSFEVVSSMFTINVCICFNSYKV